MKKMMSQEVTKLMKQKLVLKHTISLFLLISGMALVTKYGSLDFFTPEKMLLSLFNSSWLVVFFMVYLASQIFVMEFQFGTIKNLLMNGSDRQGIFSAKVCTLIGYSLFLKTITILFTVVLTYFLFPDSAISSLFQQQLFVDQFFKNILGGYIGMWLFAGLSLMISLLIKNEALAGMLGIAFYFVSSMLAGVQFVLIDQYSWLKWNPFNMLNLANQLVDGSLKKLTLLSTSQLTIGNLTYILLFLALSGIAFNKKRI